MITAIRQLALPSHAFASGGWLFFRTTAATIDCSLLFFLLVFQ